MSVTTKCNDKKCKLKEKCYRFTAKDNKIMQFYFFISPRESKSSHECYYFLQNS